MFEADASRLDVAASGVGSVGAANVFLMVGFRPVVVDSSPSVTEVASVVLDDVVVVL